MLFVTHVNVWQIYVKVTRYYYVSIVVVQVSDYGIELWDEGVDIILVVIIVWWSIDVPDYKIVSLTVKWYNLVKYGDNSSIVDLINECGIYILTTEYISLVKIIIYNMIYIPILRNVLHQFVYTHWWTECVIKVLANLILLQNWKTTETLRLCCLSLLWLSVCSRNQAMDPINPRFLSCIKGCCATRITKLFNCIAR